MGVIQYTFRSIVLECTTTITITMPEYNKTMKGRSLDEIYPEGKKWPTIYLLHGGGGCSSDWVKNTQVDMLGTEKDFMTVSIDAMESFYSDMVHGRKYFTYLTEEVMRIVQNRFNSSPKREDNFIIGFSMGAHGSMKVALRCPEKICGSMVDVRSQGSG